MTWVLVGACVVAAIPAGLRWLRVAQREHYLPGAVTRFSWRWWRTDPANVFLGTAALLGVGLSVIDYRYGFLVPVVQVVGPVGLSISGVTSPLAWTARLRRVAATTGLLLVVLFGIGGLLDAPVLVVATLLLISFLVDFSLWALVPYEKRLGGQWVERATAKLRSVDPDVVAITGSFGKTTTKNYVAHLLSGSRRVVASPASFNNRMGLARAINENLVPGTEVFVAEMGTYGFGEIAELCEWIPPKVAAMVSIGPVHLERFRSRENIALAKSEILDRAEVGVVCVDYPELAVIAEQRRTAMRIIEVSARQGITIDGRRVADVPPAVFGVDLAVALGICDGLGVDPTSVLDRVTDLPVAEHRQSLIEAGAGFTIVDDTFNSNPDGARSALAKLATVADGGTTAVITPGMVELGKLQDQENRSFAAAVSEQVDHLIIVGRTNRRALQMGSANGRASVTVVDTRDEAVAWARENLGPGDAVLYENDLPDHYP